MPNILPYWSNNETIVSIQTLVRTTVVRGTIDLTTKVGARIFTRVGRRATTALTNGVDVLIRAIPNSDIDTNPQAIYPFLSGTVAAASVQTITAGVAGTDTITVTPNTTGYAAGDVCFIGHLSTYDRVEWHRISRVVSSTQIKFDRPLLNSHTNGLGDSISNKADVFVPVWVQGGSIYEVIFDYGDDAAGGDVIIHSVAQVYEKDYTA